MNGAEVRVYSLKQDGSKRLSPHFRVREFACADGTDAVFVSLELVEVLEKVRTHFEKPLHISSGYRTAARNRAVGGAAYSRHQYGMAADVWLSGVSPAEVAAYAETLLPASGGIGVYDTFTHIDVRSRRARWKG